jgi:hypothetical protein
MRKSKKQIAEERKRRRQLIFGISGGSVLLLALAAILVAFSVGSDEHRANACVIADVSKSTKAARKDYGDDFSRFATSIGLDGSGDLCVIFAAADPLAESLPEPLFVGPAEAKKGGLEELSDIERKVATAREDLEARLADPAIRERGSALLEASADASQFLEPGDRLLYLSDGLQWTPRLHLSTLDLTPGAIATLLGDLEAEGLVPDLDGVEISFPRLLIHPGGLKEERVRQIIDFWEAWAERAGASITVRKPVEL